MKKYFVAIYDNKIIGYHDEKYVIKSYLNQLLENNNIYNKNIRMGKIEKHNLKKINDYQDLYLVKYGHGYIQMKYYDSCYVDKRDIYDMFKDTKDALLTLIESIDDEKDIKYISKTIDILEKKMEDIEYETPSYEEAKDKYDREEMYRTIMNSTNY